MTDKPIAVDLCCGLGGWTAGLLAEGWRVVGFDLVRPKTFPAGALFVQQDIRTISARSWRGYVDLIVASPPCTEFSQCWNFARHRTPDPVGGMVLVRECFRIAAECGAPMVLENVAGARKWFAPEFGPPSMKIGSFYFWGESLVLRPQGRFVKGIWSTDRDKTGARLWARDNRAATYVRDPAERARIPIEIARAVASQLRPLLLLVALSIGALGCRSVPHCESRYVPMTWTDGSVSVMPITYCGTGSIRIVPARAPR